MTQAIAVQKQRTEVRPDTELSLRVETAGYGGVPVRAIVPGKVFSNIENGQLPVEAELKIRVPGYGWRSVSARIFSGGEQDSPNGMKSVSLKVPGYGHAPLKMRFPSRTR